MPRDQRLARARITLSYIEPLRFEDRDVAPPVQKGGWLLGKLVPILLGIVPITGLFVAAIDLTAGERERGTLQTFAHGPGECRFDHRRQGARGRLARGDRRALERRVARVRRLAS